MNGFEKAAHRPKKADGRKELGRWGEEQAVVYLIEAGMRLIARNWRARSGELDAVLEDGETLVFLEVRTRRSAGRFGSAEESVDMRKQKQVRETAQLYLHTTGGHNRKCRFDVVAVTGSPEGILPPVIRHIPFAF